MKWMYSTTFQTSMSFTIVCVISTYIATSGFVPTYGSKILTYISIFVVLTSFSTNLVCDFIPKSCTLNTSSFITRIISICPCSWVLYGSFSSWPPPLKSFGCFVYTSAFWVAPLLRFCGSSICTSSFWDVLVGLTSISST